MEKRVRRKKKNNTQGVLLSVAGLLGLIKQIPLTNIIGDSGNAYYAAAYGIFMVLFAITSYGLPEAVGQLVRARISKEQYKNAGRVMGAAIWISLLLSFAGSALVFLTADVIAAEVMKEPLCMYAVRAFLPALPIFAVVGAFRGYFQGLGTKMPTMLSEIIQKVILLITVLIGADILSGYGADVGRLLKNEEFSAAFGGMGAAAATGIGALAGMLFLLFVYQLYRGVLRKQEQKDTVRSTEAYGQIIKLLVCAAVPVIIPVILYVMCHLSEHAVFNRYMMDNGMAGARAAQWGVYFGKYQVLTGMMVLFATGNVFPMLPGILNAIGKADYKQARDRIGGAIHQTMFLAIPGAVFLVVSAKPLISFFYDGEMELASGMLRVGALLVVLMSFALLTGKILFGMGRKQRVLLHILIAVIVQLILFVVFLFYLKLGIYSAVYAEMVSVFLCDLLNLLLLGRGMHYRQEWIRTCVVPLIASAGMGIAEYLLLIGFSNLMGNMAVLPVALIGLILYLTAEIALKGISEKELMRMLGGGIVVKAAKAVRLL
ncbi:MAG: polysaccharide biosynthesis protein [Lachnospiraceae bacterium]|nr:polysaccharide biosynthesis protein [Lachnospiraceae bacterium]